MMYNNFLSEVKAAADFIRGKAGSFPQTAIAIGSGLGAFLNSVSASISLNYSDIPCFPASTVAGHKGALVIGLLEGRPLALWAGRKHLYEGAGVNQSLFSVYVMAELGVKILILTNAAGGVSNLLQAGDLMLIADHINLMFKNFQAAAQAGGKPCGVAGERQIYDAQLQQVARDAALREGIVLKEGIYLATCGPNYETKAEIQFMKFLGADAVGMSTAPEALMARQLGMRVLGISFISNSAVLPSDGKTAHEEVLANARLVEVKFSKLMTGIVKEIVSIT